MPGRGASERLSPDARAREAYRGGMRLYEVVQLRRDALVARWLEAVRGTLAPTALPSADVVDSLPAFLDEFIGALRAAATATPAGGLLEKSPTAAEHGRQRLHAGFDVTEVVREYGVLRDCILDLAEEQGVALTVAEVRALSRALDVARATAVSQYILERDREQREQAALHVAFLAHEIRNPLGSARLALQALRARGVLPPDSRQAEVLELSLARLQEQVDHSLLDVRLKASVPPQRAHVRLRNLLHDVVAESATDAEEKGLQLEVEAPAELSLMGDARMLRSALSNLVRNGVKFSHPGGRLSVRGHDAGVGRVAVDVADSCGGLPPGKVEKSLFDPFVQVGVDRSGFGLGLAIARQVVEAHGGTVRVHNVPGTGCIFTLELPSVDVGA